MATRGHKKHKKNRNAFVIFMRFCGSVFGGNDLDVIQCRRLSTVGHTLDTNFIAFPESNAMDGAAGRRRAVDLPCREPVGGRPLIDELVSDPDLKKRHAILLIEILDDEIAPAVIALVFKAAGAPCRGALHGCAAGRRLPWDYRL